MRACCVKHSGRLYSPTPKRRSTESCRRSKPMSSASPNSILTAGKYDDYLAGKAKLTEQEARGLALFNDPAKGNCAHWHISAPGRDGTPPQFTDYGLAALGVPRNM